MAIDFNHTIVSARDSKASAEFLAEMLGLPAPRKRGPFQMVTTENGANIDFMKLALHDPQVAAVAMRAR
jgi:hypothetical protein